MIYVSCTIFSKLHILHSVNFVVFFLLLKLLINGRSSLGQWREC